MSKQRKKTRRDVAEIALSVVERAIGEKLAGEPKPVEPPVPDTRNPAAVALSKLGASKGGKARAAKLSAKRRKEIAEKAAKSRWRKGKNNSIL
ncbi:MAG: hypothetical protein Q7R41_10540 [Phycisphaerales bacterium]|nr:hypothetical protein [Phycisphaerales bacterium]